MEQIQSEINDQTPQDDGTFPTTVYRSNTTVQSGSDTNIMFRQLL